MSSRATADLTRIWRPRNQDLPVPKGVPDQRQPVIAPEQLLADDESRNAEGAMCSRLANGLAVQVGGSRVVQKMREPVAVEPDFGGQRDQLALAQLRSAFHEMAAEQPVA